MVFFAFACRDADSELVNASRRHASMRAGRETRGHGMLSTVEASRGRSERFPARVAVRPGLIHNPRLSGGDGMSVQEQRAAAVARTMDAIRTIEREKGITPQALDAIKAELTTLASRTELFPRSHFPVPAGSRGMVYRLSEDADLRFALYASAGVPGKAQPPHNHTTWASISGVYGDEHNVFYERIDNRDTPGQGRLRRTGELTVRKGSAVAFMPDDFHTIEVLGDEPSLHLHVYGRSLEDLPGRIAFASADGGAYKVFPANPNIVVPVVPPQELKAMLNDDKELALLDVREEGVFSKSHLLFAVPCPLSRLEQRIATLVPRTTTRIMLCDDGGGLALRAAKKLMHFGYRDLSILEGGIAGWKAAGYELFSGVHVPSKAFGEFVEHDAGTPHLSAPELKARLDRGEDIVILDSRPMSEYRRMNIPGGIDCPGAELVHRFFETVRSPDTLVIVNCAGRTRSIIGAQSLINAGVPNKVMALKDGTMGWLLAGYQLETGQTRHAPDPGPEARAKAQAAASRWAQRAGVRAIDRATLALFAAETDRSLYLLDVRSPEEYASGHLPGTQAAPGGQLVQSTDQYVGTRNARLVLIDDDGVRARMTASWLVQMGWKDVHVLDGAFDGQTLEKGPERARVLGVDRATAETIAVAAIKDALAKDEVVVVDLETSLRYRDGHIQGAWWAVRSRLSDALPKLPNKPVVFTSPDGVLARFAASEAGSVNGAPARALEGGTRAWREAGLPLDTGHDRLADTPDDVWYKPYDHGTLVENAMRAYLTWEVGLVPQIHRDGDARFKVLSPAPASA
jgi:rhodanese-related sulfurtransferase/predicted metal-dependent enzyme (double-stranded beta helix superfamily)